MADILISIVGGFVGFGIILGFALALVQIMGIDRDKMQYKTGKLTKATKKQTKYAFIISMGVIVIIAIIWLLT